MSIRVVNHCCDRLLVSWANGFDWIAMSKQVDRIDSVHSRAICGEIAERLRASLSNPSLLPAFLGHKLDRLREMEDRSPSIVPSMKDDRCWPR